MFDKSFRYYVILCFIQIFSFIYVNGKSTLKEADLSTLFDDSWQTLAQDVCSDLEYIENVSRKVCIENFFKVKPPMLSKRLAPVKIRCMTENNIVFQIEPSQHTQLVILVPEQTSDELQIMYSIVESRKEYAEISTDSEINYTLWSTELLVDIPIEWRGGDKVPQYMEPLEQKTYDVKIEFDRKNIKNKTLVNGRFSWNVSEVNDLCFDVVNICEKTDLNHTNIWPNHNAELVLTDLFVDDVCTIKVNGLYGTTEFRYRTPPCTYYYDCVASSKTPEIPQDVTIETKEESPEVWEMRVKWSPPQRPVDRYNVTYYSTHHTLTQIVPGHATEAVFKGITEGGLFDVSLYAILGSYAAHTSRRIFIPEARGHAGGGAARGVALGAAASAAATLVLLCLWRRRQRPDTPPDYPGERKPSKESDIETISVKLETEDSWEIRSDKLLLHEVIGEGAFGVVRRATLAPNGTNVAVKMLKDFPSLEEIRSFRSEMELMKSVGVHPHLVSLVGCCSGRRPLIIAEYCSRGDLLTYLRCTWDMMVSKRNVKYYNNNFDTSDYRNDLFKCNIQMENSKLVVNKLYELQEICDKELTPLDLLSFCRQIAMGMEFLAANRVVHRDLAARNILVTADMTLKIADFGLSRDVYEENQYKQKGNGKMPIKWMAIESLTRRIYTTQSDVWSFGVVVWEVATVGAAPYASVPAARLPRLLRAGYRMPRPANCSPQLYDIMLSCWRSRPRARPTFAELHGRLDELLNCASAHQYLSLELEPPAAPPRHRRYLSVFTRGKRNYWPRNETYERPLKPSQSNHYTSPPVVITKTPAV